MKKRILPTVAVIAVIVVGFIVVRVVQERAIGDGPITTALRPSGPTREIAFVANAVEGSISAVDVESRERIGTFDIIPDGAKVGLFRNPLQSLVGQPRVEKRGGLNFAQDTDVSPDGRVLYVSRGHLADVAAFDLATGRMLWRRPIGVGRSDHMAITPDGHHLFVSDLLHARVKRIDTRTGRITGELVSGVFPHDIQFSHDGARVYNASLGNMRVGEKERDDVTEPKSDNGFAYQITVADASTLETVDRYRFPRGIRPFHLSPDDQDIYAQLSNTHDVVHYDVRRKAIVQQLHLPVADGIGPEDWDFEAPHHGLAITGDGSTLCVAGRASDYAGIVAVAPLRLIATVPVSDAPSWAAIDAQDRWCMTANTRADEVSFVSIAGREEVARVSVGRGPKHITLAQVPVPIIASIRSRSMAAAD